VFTFQWNANIWTDGESAKMKTYCNSGMLCAVLSHNNRINSVLTR
jgi:hypothetical protein